MKEKKKLYKLPEKARLCRRILRLYQEEMIVEKLHDETFPNEEYRGNFRFIEKIKTLEDKLKGLL